VSTLTLPNIDEELKKWTEEFKKPQGSWQVILYNDNHNAFDNVVLWLQKSTGCSQDRASDIAATAHTTGRAVCYGGDREKCHQVAAYLRGKGLQVEVDNASN
jgi:ATP-dependent Clp protease adapter protein ClpS